MEMNYIGIFLLTTLVLFPFILVGQSQSSGKGTLNLVFTVDLHDGMDDSTVLVIEQFVLNVANETFTRDPDTNIIVFPSTICYYFREWWTYWWQYRNCTAYNNITMLKESVSFVTSVIRQYKHSHYYYHHHFWITYDYLKQVRSNNSREMIFMITDGYHRHVKENAQHMLEDHVTIAAVIRTENDTEVHNMENATGDPSLVLDILSFDDLSTIVDDCVQIILMGDRNISGVPIYEVSNHKVGYSLDWIDDTPALSFLCNFKLTPASQELVYSVTWYVNGRIIGHKRMFRANETEKNVLTEKELTDNGYRHGINLRCSVSAKYSLEGRSGRTFVSANFFAGFEVLTNPVNIEESKNALLVFRPTVPFACENAQSTCKLSVHIENSPELGCQENAVVTSSERCRVQIAGYNENDKDYYSQENNWKSQYNMTVKHTQSTSYIKDTYHAIALKTSAVKHTFWSLRQLATIPVNFSSILMEFCTSTTVTVDFRYKVHVYSEDTWRGASCYCHIDPHCRTFDKRKFEQQRQGHYIMYRNMKLDQEVQYETAACLYNDRSPFCICGVVIRAGRDVFLMYFCHDSRIIDFVSCKDDTLTVESDRFSGYKVLLPSGTEVDIRLMYWRSSYFMNVDIYPTPSDVMSTEGLCGSLDGNCNNDFVKRDGTYSSMVTYDACPPPHSVIHPDDFSESWRPTADEDILPPISHDVYDKLQPWSQQLLLCYCELAEVNGGSRPSGSIDDTRCEAKSYRDCVVSRYEPFSCDVPYNGHLRKRRDINERISSRFMKLSVDIDPHSVKRRSTAMTEAEARSHCNHTLYSSTVYRLCQESVTEIDDSFMEDCVLDVMMTGDINVSYVQLQVAKDACLTFVGKNTTLNDSSPEVVYAVQNQSCMSDCSEQGTCDKGVCDCNDGFGGDDCSVDLSKPPVVTGISQGDYCDVSEDECSSLKIHGREFYSLMPRCRVEYKIIKESGDILETKQVYFPGEQKSQFEATCDIQSIRFTIGNSSSHGFVTSFTVSVSNDEMTYSQSVTTVLFDSGCQKKDSVKGRFVLKENYCFIERTCYYHGNNHPTTVDKTCCSTIDSFQWHPSSNCESEEIIQDADRSIITVLPAVLVIFVLIMIAVIYFKKSRCIRKEKEVQPTDPVHASLPIPKESAKKPIFPASNDMKFILTEETLSTNDDSCRQNENNAELEGSLPSRKNTYRKAVFSPSKIKSPPRRSSSVRQDRYECKQNIDKSCEVYFYKRSASIGSIDIFSSDNIISNWKHDSGEYDA